MRRYKNASDIKVGVIGYGSQYNMGKFHLEKMANVGMKPTVVVELDEQRLAVARKDFPGIETYTSVDQMLAKSKVDLVTIITPHHTHGELALKCLSAGRHVVCEKPMAVTTDECDAMINEAQKQQVVLTAYHNRHWDGCVLQAVKVIDSGVIGEVSRVAAQMGVHKFPGDWWRSNKSISGGALYDWGVHFAEYALQMIDSQIVEVSGFSHWGHWASKSPWAKDANEDEATAVVRFANGVWLTITITYLDHYPKENLFEITGTEGTLLLTANRWKTVRIEGDKTVTNEGPNVPSDWPRYHQNLIEHLVKGKPLIITPEWSRRTIHILDLATRSAEKGVTLKAKYP